MGHEVSKYTMTNMLPELHANGYRGAGRLFAFFNLLFSAVMLLTSESSVAVKARRPQNLLLSPLHVACPLLRRKAQFRHSMLNAFVTKLGIGVL